MSYFDDASLVMIPSGYKTSKVYSVKPTDGSGDLTFTRSNDTASRIAPNGLIEKVRTNLALYSEQFDNAWWTASNITITANNTTDPFGGSAADKALCAAGTISPNIFSSSVACTIGVEYTASYYAKQGSSKYAKIRFGGLAFASSTNSPIFDLNTGTIVSGTGVITSVGNGWYRISATQVAEASTNGVFTVDVPDSTGVWPNGTFAGTEFIYIFGYQFEISVGVSPYIATTSTAVSVGPVANVPRLDYLGSSCPRLLLEPQRTNLVTYSEQLNNAAWNTFRSSVTANATTSPDGYTNAEKLIQQSGQSAGGGIFQVVTISNATTYTYSYFAKAAGYNWTYARVSNSPSDFSAWFNLSTGVVGSTTGGVTSSSIVSYGNGWYRCSMTFTSAGTSATPHIYIANSNGSDQTPAADGVKGIFAYGAQLEAGAYATSYIPTLGAAVTRGADAASKTSASALIGQTEGTIFWELDVKIPSATALEAIVNIDNGAGFGNTIYIYSTAAQIIGEMYVSSTNQASFSKGSITAGVYKCALAYANNNTAFFVNGVQVGSTDTSCSVPATSRIQMGQTALSSDTSWTKQLLLFKTRLTNAQLAELTTL